MNITSVSLKRSFFANLFLSIIKVVSGILGNSSALIADGIHSFSDLSTDVVALFGNYYSLKPADKEHPFGHGRMEYLTCLIISMVVLLLGFEIVYNAFKLDIIIPNKIVILISILTIIIKIVLADYLIKTGKKNNNSILIASGKESNADVVSSLFVLVSSFLMQLSGQYEILKYSNIIATIIVGLFIIKTGFSILKENVSSILGEQVDDEKTENLINVLKCEKSIIQIDSFIVLKNGPYFQITGEVSMDEEMTLKDVHNILERIEKKLKKIDARAKYINIHVNPIKRK